jgi:hypothetical protein
LLTTIIVSPEVKALSLGALEQMSLDLMQCEGEPFERERSLIHCLALVFASKINIANMDSETLLLCFQDLRQVMLG